MDLSHPTPRMSREAQDATAARLAQPCGCGGTTATLRRRLHARGIVAVCVQCDHCGRQLGGAMRRDMHFNWQSYPEWDQALCDAAEERERQEREARAAAWGSESPLRSAAYRQSLDCPEWRDLRARVLERDRFTCQACLGAEAEEVHHLRYADTWPLWRVPAWSMVAVCRPCHAKQHADAG